MDKIITNIPNLYRDAEIISPTGLSDHRCVVLKPLQHVPTENPTRKRKVRLMPDSKIREYGKWILDYDWAEVYSARDLTEKCSAFYSTLLTRTSLVAQ